MCVHSKIEIDTADVITIMHLWELITLFKLVIQIVLNLQLVFQISMNKVYKSTDEPWSIFFVFFFVFFFLMDADPFTYAKDLYITAMVKGCP